LCNIRIGGDIFVLNIFATFGSVSELQFALFKSVKFDLVEFLKVSWSPGDCLIVCPIPKASIKQLHMMVIVTGYTLLVTSQYDVISTFVNQSYDEVCW